jgi:hypothetical protein
MNPRLFKSLSDSENIFSTRTPKILLEIKKLPTIRGGKNSARLAFILRGN